MTLDQIKSVGNFLSTYYSDLVYIRDFKRYRKKRITSKQYLAKSSGTYYQFLIEFRVIRNVNKNKVDVLLDETMKWIESSDAINVDGFALRLRETGITHGKVMTSLASKILFLYDPSRIIPFDNLAKRSLNQKNNLYRDYIPRVEKFKNQNNDFILETFKNFGNYIEAIENEFKDEIQNVENIRFNRLADKLLWTGVKLSDT